MKIEGLLVAQDMKGRFRLNDLHLSSGGEQRHRPSLWTRTEQFKELVSELSTESILAPAEILKGGSTPGIYVCRELVYAYAMWISPSFHLRVIRAFDAMASGTPAPVTNAEPMRFVVDNQGRFLLLPIYHAAGSLTRHRPAFWLMQPETRAIISRLQHAYDFEVCSINARGLLRGTYVVRELVEHYACWVDPDLVPEVIAALKRKPIGIRDYEKISRERISSKLMGIQRRAPALPKPAREQESRTADVHQQLEVLTFMHREMKLTPEALIAAVRKIQADAGMPDLIGLVTDSTPALLPAPVEPLPVHQRKILRMREVMKRTGFGRAWIYRMIERGEFPAQIKIGRRAVGFIEQEVDNWINAKINKSR
ncbi:TPA: KilA-N domain-containing protein [Klebsiella oxytoca]